MAHFPSVLKLFSASLLALTQQGRWSWIPSATLFEPTLDIDRIKSLACASGSPKLAFVTRDFYSFTVLLDVLHLACAAQDAFCFDLLNFGAVYRLNLLGAAALAGLLSLFRTGLFGIPRFVGACALLVALWACFGQKCLW
jgi:hypothetical protein